MLEGSRQRMSDSVGTRMDNGGQWWQGRKRRSEIQNQTVTSEQVLTLALASATLVRTAGLREWMRILCSICVYSSSLMQFSAPRFFSIIVNDAPL